MILLANLVCGVLDLPDKELRPGVPLAERQTEMALISEIIHTDEIDEWKKSGVDVRRACFKKRNVPSVKFQVNNGSLHVVIASWSRMTGLVVTDNGETLPVTTVEEFASHIRTLAERDTT